MKKYLKPISLFLSIIFLNQLVFPTYVYALTGGPSQPEVQSFEPIATTDMVDVFSGDFNYNIPLLDVDGYPINISYHSGIGMDQEASWTGLGWNINPGVILRNMRGLPDDFNGDQVVKSFNLKPNSTYGVSLSPEMELFGANSKASLQYSFGISWNNYNGVALENTLNLGVTAGKYNKGKATCGLGLTSSSESGASVNPSISFSKEAEDKEKRATTVTGRIGLPFNSRGGLSSLTFGTSVNKSRNTFEKNSSNENKNVWKNDNVKTSVANGGSSISFGYPSHTPSISRPMVNVNLSLSATFGGAVFGGHLNGQVNGYYAGQYLATKVQYLNAYGYLNLQQGQNMDDNGELRGVFSPDKGKILDFNREKDGGFNENTPSLPLTNLTYDIYSVNGQGIGGTYRPTRSDYGAVFDNTMENTSVGINFPGIEVGLGNLAHPGINFSLNSSITTTGAWHEDNNALENLKFRDYGNNEDKMFEPYYFKQAGEKIPESDLKYFEKTGGFEPVRFAFNKSNKNMTLLSVLLKNDDNIASISTKGVLMDKENFRKTRAKRNEVIVPLSANEASKVGLQKELEVYQRNNFSNGEGSFAKTLVNRNNFPRKPHHVSEISAYRADGARYVYGIPASNYKQKDVSFAIVSANFPGHNSEQTSNCSKGLVEYSTSGNHPDNSVENKRGLDNFFESTETPSYPHSYLLTSVLSSDYVDVDGDGPTINDIGGYTKINYFLASNNATGTDKSHTYKWRVPFEEKMASHNEGLKSLKIGDEFNDDKGSYVYGEKELWYVHSIESKNYIAVFYTSDRNDGFGVKDENGGFHSDKKYHVRMQKLDSIALFSRQDVDFNKIKASPTDLTGKAIPIKTVHFVYDYSLCQGLPNFYGSGEGGKLTLKKIYFTNGYSKREQFSPYTFEYGEVILPNGTVKDFNPEYNIKGYDRWGNFKGIKSSTTCDQSMAEFPYTDQGKLNSQSESFSSFTKSDYESLNPILADLYSYSWNLTSVKLPSGGLIKVTYESDDYAYVQDKKAMEMVEIFGTLQSSEINISSNGLAIPNGSPNFSQLYGTNATDAKNFIIFKLRNKVVSATTNGSSIIQNQYLRNESNKIPDLLYFKFLVDLKDGNKEFVPGYVKFKKDGNGNVNCGLYKHSNQNSGDDFTFGFVEIETTKGPNGNDYQSIAVAALNFIKLNLPKLAYESASRNDNGVLQIFAALKNSITNVSELFTTYLASMHRNNFAQTYVPEKSMIRLYSSTLQKKGGGSRVSKLVMNDQWKELTGQSTYASSEYGQVYDYTQTIQDINNPGTNIVISSGVASYEPILGGEENPFKQPDYYEIEKLLAPDESHYQEFPYGESFFPAASVGYSKVTIKNLPHENVTGHATGKIVHEYYTSKDFPTIVKMTPLDANRHIPPKILKFLWCDYKDYVTASQGYSIELNDMHGKEKAQWVFQEGKNSPISGVEYKYKQSADKRLDNNFTAIDKSGSAVNIQIGVEQDFVADFRQESSKTISSGLGGNLDAFFAAIFPAAIVTVFPSYSQEETRFRSSVVTKVINRYGILETTIAHDLGANVATTNVALDANTGEVLLTKTTNQFNDSIYNLTLPAHFAYDGMGQAYQNIGYYGTSESDFKSNLNNFVEGDELLFETSRTSKKVWFLKQDVAPYYKLLTVEGYIVSESEIQNLKFFKVVRSGRRNVQNNPIGKYVLTQNPIKEVAGKQTLVLNNGILNADITEYSNQWKIDCNCHGEGAETFIYNPFTAGKLGIWRPLKSWKYLTDRAQTVKNNNTNIRKDGVYLDFQNFWTYDKVALKWVKSNAPKWQFSSEISVFHPFGFEAENKDALGRYSAANYGYRFTIPNAVGTNGMYSDIAYDGFEDYYYYSLGCSNGHFSYFPVVNKGTGAGVAPADGNSMLVNTTSHTGQYSVKVKNQQQAKITKKINQPCN